MSSNLPPTGPPSEPPTGPPTGPEYLDSGAGGPIPPRPRAPKGSGRRTAAIAGGALVGLAAVGVGGVVAWSAFFGVGAQPAEALPASTLGYVSIDADPSGDQKIEALRTLNKFPAFEDEVGLTSDGDIAERVFEEVQKEGSCADVDFGDDVEPWLGDRLGVAAVDLGEGQPAPVLVVQVKDAEAADAGLGKLQSCSGAGEDASGGWVIEGGWALVSETSGIAEDVADAREDGTLAADEDFQRWTGKAGDPGVITAYAAPEVGEFLAEGFSGFGGEGTVDPALLSADGLDDDFDGDLIEPGPLVPPELTDALEDFGGAALTVRFDDGALEIETATGSDLPGLTSLGASDRGGDVISTLPADTAAAFGLGFEEGWFDDLVGYLDSVSAGAFGDIDGLFAEIEEQTGFSVPEDVETLAGESLAVSIGADVDPEVFFNSEDGSDVPVGVKIKGDGDEIDEVIDKILSSPDVAETDEVLLGTDTDGDFVAIGPNDDYRQKLLEDGDLGDSDTYQNVIRENGLSSVLFVDLGAVEDVLGELVGDDEELQENLEPLQGLGFSAWVDDEVGHSVLRVTTD